MPLQDFSKPWTDEELYVKYNLSQEEINFIANSQKNVQETFLCSSESPDGKFNLEAYRTEPGATVDYSVRVYMINGNQKEIIYNAYHESEAKIDWVDNTTVSINGKTLDMSSGETYDWRKE